MNIKFIILATLLLMPYQKIWAAEAEGERVEATPVESKSSAIEAINDQLNTLHIDFVSKVPDFTSTINKEFLKFTKEFDEYDQQCLSPTKPCETWKTKMTQAFENYKEILKDAKNLFCGYEDLGLGKLLDEVNKIEKSLKENNLLKYSD